MAFSNNRKWKGKECHDIRLFDSKHPPFLVPNKAIMFEQVKLSEKMQYWYYSGTSQRGKAESFIQTKFVYPHIVSTCD